MIASLQQVGIYHVGLKSLTCELNTIWPVTWTRHKILNDAKNIRRNRRKEEKIMKETDRAKEAKKYLVEERKN